MNQGGVQNATGGDFAGMDNADISANIMAGGNGFAGGQNPYIAQMEQMKKFGQIAGALGGAMGNKQQGGGSPVLMQAPGAPMRGDMSPFQSFAALSPYFRGR